MRPPRATLVPLLALSIGACAPERDDRGGPGRASVVAATQFAFALEDSADARRADLRSRDALLALFAQGFEPDIAAALTDRLWDTTRQEVLGTEQAIAAPESVVVLAIEDDSAVVTFTTPVDARWADDAPYTVAWLRRRDGVWRVAGARDTATPPAPLPPPPTMPDGAP